MLLGSLRRPTWAVRVRHQAIRGCSEARWEDISITDSPVASGRACTLLHKIRIQRWSL